MATMNISLPAAMKEWVETQTDNGRYGNASELVRELIRREQDNEHQIANMQRLVDEGRASGISTESLDDLRARGLRQIAARAEHAHSAS